MPTNGSQRNGTSLRVMSFDDLMGCIVCPVCDRKPHPHTAMVLKAGDRCDRSDCGKGFYIHDWVGA